MLKAPLLNTMGGVISVLSIDQSEVELRRCFRGRCNFEPAVIVRDPMPARYRLTQ